MRKSYKAWKQSQRQWAIANAGKIKPKPKLIPVQDRHLTHPVEVRAGKAHNAGQLFCIECQKHIKWLSRWDYEFLLRELDETDPTSSDDPRVKRG